MTISFPEIERWDGPRNVVLFTAYVDGKQVDCAISLEVLEDNFGGHIKKAIECFKANRGANEATAEQLIRRGRFEVDGSILIVSRDGK